MEKNEGFDVLRLIEHGNICYVSSEYLPGKLLVYWLKEGKTLKKEDLFCWVRDMTKDLMRIYRCQGSHGYGFVNPYCILISEDSRLYYLDMEAKSNEKILRQLSKDPVIRHYFLPEEAIDSRQRNLKEELYGMGKTLQYILSVAYIRPELTKKEERKLKKFISRCVNETGKTEIQDPSKLFQYLPEPEHIREGAGARKNVKLIAKVGFAMVLLVIAVGVKNLAFKGDVSLAAKDETKQEKNLSEKESDSENKAQNLEENLEELSKTEDNFEEKEALLEKSATTVMKLALNYFLELDDSGKALNVLEENLEELNLQVELQENLEEEQENIKNDFEEIKTDQGVTKEMKALVCIIKACSNPEEELSDEEDFNLMEKSLEVIKADQGRVKNTDKAWCLVRGYGLLAEKRKAWEEKNHEAEKKSEYADLVISTGEKYLKEIGIPFPTETTPGVNVDLLEEEGDNKEDEQMNRDSKENKDDDADLEVSEKTVKEIKETMATAYGIKGNLQVAIEEWQTLLDESTGWGEREKIYLKMEELYEGDGQTDQAINTCLQGLEDCYESWSLRKIHIRLLCSDKGMDRAICAETIKNYLSQYPDLKEDEEFKELQKQYEIKIEGEGVTVK